MMYRDPRDRRRGPRRKEASLFSQGAPLLVPLLLACWACGPAPEPEPPPEPPEPRAFTYRAMGGVSMGAMGASMIGSRNPALFDAIGGLGAPMDYAYLLYKMRTQYLGGFCSYEDLLAILDEDPALLNDPATMDACAVRGGTGLAWEHDQSFNHWHFDDGGGAFHRSSYLDKFHDLALALGNPAHYNPDSPFYPPGMDDDWSCNDPVVIRGYDSGGDAPIYNAEYNPEGRFDVISFCDGHQPVMVCDATGELVDYCAGDPVDFCGDDGPVVRATSQVHPDAYYAYGGRHDPCRPTTKRVFMSYAVDLNGNGRRDYGEPVIWNGMERFEDEGDEDGELYHWLEAPFAPAGNWTYDEGEPFLDHGLDGVEGTGSFGEGDGGFTMSPNVEKYFDHDPRTSIRGWSSHDLATTDLYLDGGVRDVMNFGIAAAQIFGLLAGLTGEEAAWYQGFEDLPSFDGLWRDGYDFREVDWWDAPRNVFVSYGDENASIEEIRRGDGGHVGTTKQAIDRFNSFFGWLGARWPDADYEEARGASRGHAFEASFYSDSLESERAYAIALPPGYEDDESSEKTYPVVYFLHGYGMGPADFLPGHLLYDDYMAAGALPKMIMVYVDGRCCYVNEDDGRRDCLIVSGESPRPPWRRECIRGSFYVNRSGYGHGDDTPYEESVLDLIRHVESTYRVRVPKSARLD